MNDVKKITFLILIFFIPVFYLYAKCYNENTCYKDYVKTKDKDVVVAVNRDTGQIELYWSEDDNTWLEPDKERRESLQKTYNKRIQLKQMQEHLNDMHDDTLFTTDEGTYPRR